MKRAAGPGTARALLLACALLSAATASAQVVVARVNGAQITQPMLDRRVEQLLRERNLNVARMTNPRQLRELKSDALDGLIREELFWQQAQGDKLVVAEAEVDEAVAKTGEQFGSPAAYRRRLAAQGFDEAGYRRYVRRLLSADRYAQAVVRRQVRISDADVEAFYRENPQFFSRPEMLSARHILVRLSQDAGAQALAEATRRIEGLRARALAGESFEQLARENSEDATRQWGGELDPFARGTFAPEFEAAAWALEAGGISPVVRSAAGLHIIQLQQRIPAVSVTLSEARQRIAEHLRSVRGHAALAEEEARLRAAGKVEVVLPP